MDSSLELLRRAFEIVLIDLLLAGDNAVVIAMATKSLPERERRWGILAGAGMAVALRIVLTFFAAKMLQVQFLKLVGGLLIFWIAYKLGAGTDQDDSGHGKQAQSLWQAMWFILVADITMSLDNILAVAGVSKGNVWLLIFGLGLSIPLVVLTANILSGLMARYPIIVWIGVAVLGRVGAEMILTDPWVHAAWPVEGWVHLALETLAAVLITAVAWWASRRRPA